MTVLVDHPAREGLRKRVWQVFLACGGILGLLYFLGPPRSPGRDRAALIDSLIIAIGVGVLSWVYLMAPYAHDPTLTLAQKLVSVAYPLGDLLLLGVVVRLAVGGGRREPAFYLLLL